MRSAELSTAHPEGRGKAKRSRNGGEKGRSLEFKMRRLFWDCEFSANTVLSWRVGRKINLPHDNVIIERQVISVAWKWQDEKKVHALDWGRNQSDAGLLAKFNKVLNQSDEAVAHFGDGYDWPMFKARCMIRGIKTNPFLKTRDTCKMAGRFGFNSKSLDYLSKVLGVGEKLDTGFGLWKRVMLENSQTALRQMVRYNCHDVFPLLQGVYEKLEESSGPSLHAGVLSGGEKWSCPKCESKHVVVNKTRVTAAGTIFKTMQCKSCGGYHSISMKSHDDYLKHLREKRK